MSNVFADRVLETGRLPLFCFFVAFNLTFVFARLSVRLIRAERVAFRNTVVFRNVVVGDTHIHHVVFGVVLMVAAGIASFALPARFVVAYAVAATLFGVGAALVLDEFALILHLRDVYWTEEGRASVDAVFVAVGLTGLLLMGATPLGFAPIDGRIGPALAVVIMVANLAAAVVCLLKGKIWTGLTGLFAPPLLYGGAFRLARPASPWARWFYPAGSRRMRWAAHREARVRMPLIRGKIWCQEAIAGRHGDRSQRNPAVAEARVSGGRAS